MTHPLCPNIEKRGNEIESCWEQEPDYENQMTNVHVNY